MIVWPAPAAPNNAVILGPSLEFDIQAVTCQAHGDLLRHVPAARAISRIKESQAQPGGNQHQARLAGIAGQHGCCDKSENCAQSLPEQPQRARHWAGAA